MKEMNSGRSSKGRGGIATLYFRVQAASPQSVSTARCTQEAGTISSERCLCCPTPAGGAMRNRRPRMVLAASLRHLETCSTLWSAKYVTPSWDCAIAMKSTISSMSCP
eukprot:jgi/Astpho2/7392/gw1.00114.264.1_t